MASLRISRFHLSLACAVGRREEIVACVEVAPFLHMTGAV
jgi:hypothetical protein